jgi:hypothetical protein
MCKVITNLCLTKFGFIRKLRPKWFREIDPRSSGNVTWFSQNSPESGTSAKFDVCVFKTANS